MFGLVCIRTEIWKLELSYDIDRTSVLRVPMGLFNFLIASWDMFSVKIQKHSTDEFFLFHTNFTNSYKKASKTKDKHSFSMMLFCQKPHPRISLENGMCCKVELNQELRERAQGDQDIGSRRSIA